MCDYEMAVAELGEELEGEPIVFPKPLVKNIPLVSQHIEDDENAWWTQQNEYYQDIFKKRLILEHERLRSQLWMKYKVRVDF